jgi:hypothetical protein
VIRALYKRLQTLTTTTAVLPESIDDLCATITDKSFLAIEEKNLLPANCTIGELNLSLQLMCAFQRGLILAGACFCYSLLLIGSPYDMRGKRFLDLKIVPTVAKSVEPASTPEPEVRTASPTRNSGSMWSLNTKRFFGSSSSSSGAAHSHNGSTSSSAVNSPASPVPAPGGGGASGGSNLAAAVKELDPIMQLVATKKKILFVQDAKSLIIVSCDKHDSKNGFKVLVAAPLLYAGKVDFPTSDIYLLWVFSCVNVLD